MLKDINTTAKQNQALWDNLGTEIPRTPERIGGRPRINKTVTNIQSTLDVHQGQDVYIWNQPYFKWLLF